MIWRVVFQSPTECDVRFDLGNPAGAGGPSVFQSPTECDVRFDAAENDNPQPEGEFQSPTECDVRFDAAIADVAAAPSICVSISYGV